MANIRPSGGLTRKATTSYATSQDASIKPIVEAGYWASSSTMYGHYIRCLP